MNLGKVAEQVADVFSLVSSPPDMEPPIITNQLELKLVNNELVNNETED